MIALFDSSGRFVETQTAICAASSSCGVNVAPLGGSAGYVADLNQTPARYILNNNNYNHNRARGALLQSPYGLAQ